MYSDYTPMAGKFDSVEGEENGFTTAKNWTAGDPHRHDGSNINMDKSNRSPDGVDPVTVNTVAAVVSALLATTFLILLVCIIRAIRKRRQARLGSRFGPPVVVHTIATSSFGANVAAYRNVPIAGRMSWENVSTSDAPILNPEASSALHHQNILR